jgi:hypothetical protein
MRGLEKNRMGRGHTDRQTDKQSLWLLDQLGPEGRVGENVCICYMLDVTYDMWQLTGDMWYVTCGGGWPFSQNSSSLALTVWNRQFLEDISTKDEFIKQIMMNMFVDSPGYTGSVNYTVKFVVAGTRYASMNYVPCLPLLSLKKSPSADSIYKLRCSCFCFFVPLPVNCL